MDEAAMREAKQQLRRQMRQQRREISPESLALWSGQLAERFCAWPLYRQSTVVMFYLAMPDEAQTDLLIRDALRRGKQVCVPLLGEKRGEMSAAGIGDLSDLMVGQYGLKMPNPQTAQRIRPETIDMVVIPAVAFDGTGHRLGMGAGYYDRFLPQAAQAVRAGLAWHCQLVGSVPAETHDVRMQYLLTEQGLVDCR